MRVLAALGVAERLEPWQASPGDQSSTTARAGGDSRNCRSGDASPQRHGAPYRVAHRADLHAALLEAARAEPLIAITTGAEVGRR